MTTTIGVISDTHGLLRPEACSALAGADLLVHAGDIGKPAVLEALRAIAPLHAIRGNVDRGDWAGPYPDTLEVEVAGVVLHLVHDVKSLAIDPAAAGMSAVICGHSHKPSIDWREGVLYFNPGSAGPRRFKLPVCVGRIVIDGGKLLPTIETLKLD